LIHHDTPPFEVVSPTHSSQFSIHGVKRQQSSTEFIDESAKLPVFFTTSLRQNNLRHVNSVTTVPKKA
ncbi:hypothetical protein, partial [Lacticaseibacillus paracasei]|uniref:hypothetical protein n=1 Tax=Lacticaseibacillus paracasei TaxID=1597 RepID=UPI003D019478